MSRKVYILRLLPFLMVALIIGYTWSNIFASDGFAIGKFKIGTILFFTNCALYMIRIKWGIAMTGLFLLGSSFCVWTFFKEVVGNSFFLKISGNELSTPFIDYRPLLVLIVYIVINGRFIFEKPRSK